MEIWRKKFNSLPFLELKEKLNLFSKLKISSMAFSSLWRYGVEIKRIFFTLICYKKSYYYNSIKKYHKKFQFDAWFALYYSNRELKTVNDTKDPKRNRFLPNVPFWTPWEHYKTKGFLMFLEGSKGKKGLKNQCKIILSSHLPLNFQIKLFWMKWVFVSFLTGKNKWY